MALSGTTPTGYSDHCTGRLAEKITATQTTGITITADTITTPAGEAPVTFPTGEMLLKVSRKTRSKNEIEILGVESASQSGSTVTLGTTNRYMSQTDGALWTSVSSTGLSFPAGSIVELVWTTHHAENTAFKNNANTFSATQTISSTNKLQLNDSGTYLKDDGSDLIFKDSNNSEVSLSTLAAGGGSDEKVAISSNDTTPDYLLNKLAAGAGITLTETNDGGDEDVTIDAVNTVATGHTGLSSVTTGGLLIGAGTSNMTIIGPGTSGQVPVSNGTTLAMAAVPITYFDKTVFVNAASSAALSNPTSLTAFDSTKQYTIPANDLVSGVKYKFDIGGTVTMGTAGDLQIQIGLGATTFDVDQVNSAPSSDWRLYGSIYGTTTAGASAAVRVSWTLTMGSGSGGKLATSYATANVATNGTLVLQPYAMFGTSNGSNSITATTMDVIRSSTTAA